MVIPKADFGRTGHKSTRVIFGAASLGQLSQKVADQTLEVLLHHGVNHIDTAASYGDSELRIAPWLKREPGRFFLATKVDKRDEKGAREQLQRSLDRLGVDHVDLWQMHSLADPIEGYQPLGPGDVINLVAWGVRARRGVSLNGVGDADLLPRVLDSASCFHQQPTDQAMDALVERSHAEPLFV